MVRASSQVGRYRLGIVLLAFPVAYSAYAAGSSMTGSARGGIPGPSVGISKARGFDTCGQPNFGQAGPIWEETNFAYVGVYVGGETAVAEECSTPSKEWFSEFHKAGFDFLPIMDGRQAPCSVFAHKFPGNPKEEFYETRHAAAIEVDKAIADMENRGLTTPGSIVYYDLEPFNEKGNTTCQEATEAFVKGWDNRLHEKYGVTAGLYGAANASNLKQFWNIKPNPDDIWFAEKSESEQEKYESVYDVNPANIPLEDWSEHRFHQWNTEVERTINGHPYTLDYDCANGLVAGTGGKREDKECQA